MWHLTKNIGGRIKREFIKHEILKLHLKEKNMRMIKKLTGCIEAIAATAILQQNCNSG